jgi:hypothetical protein
LSVSLTAGTGAIAATPATTVEQDTVAAIEALTPGEQLVLGNTLVTRTKQGLVVDLVRQGPTIHTAATFCGTALAAAIVGIGAGVLGIIAATTGSGTVLIAGYLLTGAQVGVLAGIAGSYAAVLGYISRYIC